MAFWLCPDPGLVVLMSRCSGLARAGQGFFCDLGGDGVEFGDELAEPAVGVEVAAELLGVFVVEGAGDGGAVYPAGPGGVGPVEPGRVGFAVASGSLAAGHAVGNGAGDGEAEAADLGHDFRTAFLGATHPCSIPQN
jgi:hypothetical protein